MRHLLWIPLLVAACATTDDEPAATTAAIQTLVVANGSFETGDYAGWTLFESGVDPQCGAWGVVSAGQVVDQGDPVFDFFDGVDVASSSPGLPITIATTDGVRAALQLQTCGESHRMTQTIALPACPPLLRWDMRYANHAGAFEPSSQYTAVNIRDPGGAILATPFKTTAGDPLALPAMTAFQVDLTAFSGQTVQLDFDHQVFNFFFDIQWDNIRVVCKGLGASPGALEFGVVALGGSATRTTTVTNFAQIPLTIGAAQIATGPFTIVAGPPLPLTLPPGATTAFDVAFQPIAAGPTSGVLTLASDDPNGSLLVQLTGSGPAPLVAISPPSLAFANTRVGATSAARLVQVSNPGTAPLAVSAIAIAPPFTVSAPPVPREVGPGESVTVEVRFAPAAAGPASRDLAIETDAGTATVPCFGTGIEPAIVATPSALSFGDVRTGTASAGETVTVVNTGTAALTITSAIAPAQFTIASAALPISVLPGGSLTFTVRFAPGATGPAAGDVVITSDAAGPTAVAVSGTGVAPLVVASLDPVDFGTIAIGSSATLAVELSNPGDAALTISGLAIAGPAAGDYAISGASVPAIVPPGGTLALALQFTPHDRGARPAQLAVTIDAATVELRLAGAGGVTRIAITPSVLDFGGQVPGRLAGPRPIHIRNISSDPLAVRSLAIIGSPAFALVAPPRLPATIAPSGELVVSVRVAPATLGELAASLAITTDSPDAPGTTAGLTVLGISAALSVSPSAIDFGTTHTPASGEPIPVTLVNLTGDPLTLSDAVLGGARPGDFSVSAIAAPLAPGASVTALVRYTAPTAATSAATLTFRTIDPAIPHAIVTLAGRAASTFVTADRGVLEFGAIQLGDRTGAKSITLTNVTTAPVTISNVACDDPQFVVDAAPALVQIPPGGRATFTVAFAPAIDAATAAQVLVTLAGSTAPELAIAVTGEGTTPVGPGCSTTRPSGLALVLVLALVLSTRPAGPRARRPRPVARRPCGPARRRR